MKYCFIGYGKSNKDLINYMVDKDYDLFVSQDKPFDEVTKLYFNKHKIRFEENHGEFIRSCDIAVVSPGVPPYGEAAKIIFDNKINYTTELAMSWNLIKQNNKNALFIGITGTNGKSTSTSMIGHILMGEELDTFIGGNIGTPLINAPFDYKYYVVEVSSFQLFWGKDFCPDISVILNLAPDHLNWHSTLQEYYETKLNMGVRSIENNGIVIFNTELQTNLFKSKKAVKFNKKILENGVFNFENNKIKVENEALNFDIYKENTVASIITCLKLGISEKTIEERLKNFKLLEHRLEFVRKYKGVTFLNDSKATNVHAAYNAYKSFRDKNYYAFLSGIPKKEDLTPLVDELKKYAKKVYVFGEMKKELSFYKLNTKFINVDTLDIAVKNSFQDTSEGDYVILSPAGASYDLFENFIQRGDKFKEIVKNLDSI